MKTIHKQLLELEAEQSFNAAQGISALSIQRQNLQFSLWYQTDTELPAAQYNVHIVGTGCEIPPGNLEYIASVQNGLFVWHFYLERMQ